MANAVLTRGGYKCYHAGGSACHLRHSLFGVSALCRRKARSGFAAASFWESVPVQDGSTHLPFLVSYAAGYSNKMQSFQALKLICAANERCLQADK